MIAYLLAVGPENRLGDLLVRVLAVLGAAAVGGFGMGLATKVVARLIRSKPLPRPVMTVTRLMSAIVAGWLMAMLLFGTGGSGWGWGTGTGGIGGTADDGKDKASPVEKTGTPIVEKEPESHEEAMRVEVLVPEKTGSDRFYRIDDQPTLQPLDEVHQRIAERKRQATPFKYMNIVIYKNSPDEWKQQVQGLVNLATKNELEVRIFKPSKNAP